NGDAAERPHEVSRRNGGRPGTAIVIRNRRGLGAAAGPQAALFAAPRRWTASLLKWGHGTGPAATAPPRSPSHRRRERTRVGDVRAGRAGRHDEPHLQTPGPRR